MIVSIAAIGVIYSFLFGVNPETYLPYLATGLVFWNLINAMVNDGALAYVFSEGYIHGSAAPHLTYVIRIITKAIITFAHSVIVLPLVLVVFPQGLGLSVLLFVPGLVIAIVALSAIGTVLATLATRFRDVPQILSAVMMILFYVTPVIWPFELLPEGVARNLVLVNPFTSLIQIMRLPLLNQVPSQENWLIAITTAVIAVAIAIFTYLRFDKRIAFWV